MVNDVEPGVLGDTLAWEMERLVESPDGADVENPTFPVNPF